MCTDRNGWEKGVFIGILLGSLLTVGAADNVQPLNVKAGLWEVTTTGASSKDVVLPAALLEKLSSEQRARIEERIKASRSDTAKTTIKKR